MKNSNFKSLSEKSIKSRRFKAFLELWGTGFTTALVIYGVNAYGQQFAAEWGFAMPLLSLAVSFFVSWLLFKFFGRPYPFLNAISAVGVTAILIVLFQFNMMKLPAEFHMLLFQAAFVWWGWILFATPYIIISTLTFLIVPPIIGKLKLQEIVTVHSKVRNLLMTVYYIAASLIFVGLAGLITWLVLVMMG